MIAPRVFMLEDDPTTAGLVRQVLGLEGWEFEWAGQVQEAVTLMQGFRPDIILLDVQLPDGSGYDVCRKLREVELLKTTPVIFLTSKSDVQDRLHGFEAGGQDYVPKPFDVRELIARICAHLAIKKARDTLTREKEEALIRERLRREMMDMVVHDLKAPLSAVKITLEWVRMSGLITDKQYDILIKNAEAATDMALFMIGDMLDLSAGKLKLHPSPLDLQQLCVSLETLFLPQLQSRHLTLEADLPKENPQVVIDGMLLLRILINFMSNAIKFSPQHTKIGIAAHFVDGALRVEVLDSGPGIPDHEKQRIFEKFYRAKTAASEAAPGTGIGLAFCRLAVDTLGGKVWVEDRKPNGSRFIIEIPVDLPLRLPAEETLRADSPRN